MVSQDEKDERNNKEKEKEETWRHVVKERRVV